MPEPVGAAPLFIHKLKRRLPRADFGAPADRHAVDADAIINQDARPHYNRGRREHLEFYPGRRDPFQIMSVAKKGEHLVARMRQPKLSFKNELVHKARPKAWS